MLELSLGCKLNISPWAYIWRGFIIGGFLGMRFRGLVFRGAYYIIIFFQEGGGEALIIISEFRGIL